ncbi:enhanced serine sensitivity protein SseB C-terminal domain-containing protein [Streptomyces sp. NPDC051940]|uniref:enhanced serine sensitivity protein SseB C-terminal domain-containing protein n=1 Tax=Streptomyces sp. NPDC051940 TaxID=3155675 RepID=UPI00343F0950
MSIPSQLPEPSFPVNELEEVLQAALGDPGAVPRLLEVLGRSHLWVPLPEGGGPTSETLRLPTTEIGGAAYVPVFSSKEQFLAVVGTHMSFTVAPAREFARGLPPQLGIAVNPGGAVGIPLPPAAVAELARERSAPGAPSGGRVRLYEPDWQDDPVDFLAAARAEFEATPQVYSARRGLAAVETGPAQLFVGVELYDPAAPDARDAALAALGRALAAHPVTWPVQLVFLDAADDPVIGWLRERVRPFFTR